MALIPLEKGHEGYEAGIKKRKPLSNSEDMLLIAILAFLFILFLYIQDTIYLNDFGIPIKPVILFLIAILILSRFIVKFEEYERGIIFRFGRFREVTGPGWKIILPIFERYIGVDTRLGVYTTEPHEVLTKDGIRFLIGAAIFMHVSNPRDAVINIGDYRSAVIHYVDGSLRSVCGSSTSGYIISHMDEISKTIKDGVNKLASGMKGWGVMVSRIEIKYIEFPHDVQDAMHKKAIKDMESRLMAVEPTLPQVEATKSESEEADNKPEDEDINAEVEDYEKRIKEIKKRIGLDKFW